MPEVAQASKAKTPAAAVKVRRANIGKSPRSMVLFEWPFVVPERGKTNGLSRHAKAGL
jgi:hypothetical protein